MKSPCRVSISLSSLTSTALTRALGRQELEFGELHQQLGGRRQRPEPVAQLVRQALQRVLSSAWASFR